MIGGGYDGATTLQRIPFALLDVEGRSHDVPTLDAWSCLPGLVPEPVSPAVSQPATVYWSSSSASVSVGFRREIGLRVLSSSHYHVHAIRIVFQKTKRPSRLEISTSSSTSKRRSNAQHSLDALSEYFCADFESVRPPLVWSPESALDWLLSPTEVTIPITIDDDIQHQTTGTEFIRLIVHRPHAHPENPAHEVAITALELLGTFQLPGRSIPLLEHVYVSVEHHAQPENVDSSIRRLLEAAGLPEKLIEELLRVESELPESKLPSTTPVLPQPASQVVEPVLAVAQQLPEYLLDSVFDLALRDFIDHRQREDEIFASLESSRKELRALRQDTTMETSTSGVVRGMALNSIHQNDRNHLEAIATHTFGSFFTQCLTHDDNELRITSLQAAERFAPLLPLAGMGPELVYEGLVAVVVLATESQHRNVSLGVFHAVLHLIQTVFQEQETSFRLVYELPKGKINTGLQCIINTLIQLPHCWALGAKTTINRELLKTARLLLSQKTTRTSFVLAVCRSPPGKATDINALVVVNRLRLIRWLLQRHHEKLSADDLTSIRRLCDQIIGQNTHGTISSKATELIQQCRSLVGSVKPAKEDLSAQRQAVSRHLQEQEENQASDQVKDAHVPLFDAFPLTKEEREVFIDRLRQYFQLHPRPTALYQHEFTMASLEDHAVHGEFRKGNIVFRGQVEERTVPVVSFHQDVERNAKPFRFNAPQGGDAATANSLSITMETAFAKFRGTLEERDKQPTPTPVVKQLHPTMIRPSPRQTMPQLHDQSTLSKPTPPTVRRPSNSKLNRVVPVDSVAQQEQATILPTTISSSNVVTVDPSSVMTSAPVQRASTAAPASATAQPAVPSVLGGASAFADPVPSASPTKPPLPKTAPAGKSRNSASQADVSGSGCVIQ